MKYRLSSTVIRFLLHGRLSSAGRGSPQAADIRDDDRLDLLDVRRRPASQGARRHRAAVLHRLWRTQPPFSATAVHIAHALPQLPHKRNLLALPGIDHPASHSSSTSRAPSPLRQRGRRRLPRSQHVRPARGIRRQGRWLRRRRRAHPRTRRPQPLEPAQRIRRTRRRHRKVQVTRPQGARDPRQRRQVSPSLAALWPSPYHHPRYGFFAGPSHDRLVLLASSPLLKRLAPVRAPSGTAPASPPALSSLPPTRPPPKETGRIAKWMRMMVPLTRDAGANVVTWCVKQGKEAKLRRRVYKGIPDAWRGASWDYMMERYSSLGAREVDALAREYTDALDKPSTYDVQIDLDVPRTISGHIMFRTRYGAGQRSLFHVLHSFSLRCPKCGYVQGMGPIAATLLCYFDPARVYAALVRLHDAYTLHTVFSPGFPGLLEAIYVQERITQQMMPDVFDAFRRHMISTTSYATKWYITLFSNSVPFQTQLRLWDAFLLEGYDVFVAVAVAIVWVYRDQITSSTANFETVLSLLSSFFVPEDEDVLMNWIGRTLGDKKLRASMRGWKEEWRGLVAAGKEGTALL
ncbi:hypothetical protein H2248_001432 [Termitomyces sp. 'cryptogamus']|nr:hypothetical protein H2248_001432 [Termitomyces sp. 'cryptogamus']